MGKGKKKVGVVGNCIVIKWCFPKKQTHPEDGKVETTSKERKKPLGFISRNFRIDRRAILAHHLPAFSLFSRLLFCYVYGFGSLLGLRIWIWWCSFHFLESKANHAINVNNRRLGQLPPFLEASPYPNVSSFFFPIHKHTASTMSPPIRNRNPSTPFFLSHAFPQSPKL